jgi:hypothetical protein
MLQKLSKYILLEIFSYCSTNFLIQKGSRLSKSVRASFENSWILQSTHSIVYDPFKIDYYSASFKLRYILSTVGHINIYMTSFNDVFKLPALFQ